MGKCILSLKPQTLNSTLNNINLSLGTQNCSYVDSVGTWEIQNKRSAQTRGEERLDCHLSPEKWKRNYSHPQLYIIPL